MLGGEPLTTRPSWLRFLILYAGIEIVGIGVGAAGLGVEIAYQADIGFVLVTAGALVFGIGSGLWAKVYVKGGRR